MTQTQYARIEQGIVREIIAPHPDGFSLEQQFPAAMVGTLVPAPENVTQGWRWDGSAFTAPVASLPLPQQVPAEISPRQLLLALAGAAIITEAEALAAARTGAVPASIDAIFSALPGPAAFAARVTWARMTVVLRADPMVSTLAAANGMNEAAIDGFFRAAAAL